MNNVFKIIGLLWLGVFSAPVAVPAIPDEVAAKTSVVVDIRVEGDCVLSEKWKSARASGVIFRNAVILTCGHLFWCDYSKDRLTLSSLRIINWAMKVEYTMTEEEISQRKQHLVVDADHDLAIVPFLTEVTGPKISLTDAFVGQVVWILGYESPPEIKVIRGVVSKISETELWITVDELPRHGMSGSGVFSEDGELVGILTGTLARFTIATRASLLLPLLEHLGKGQLTL